MQKKKKDICFKYALERDNSTLHKMHELNSSSGWSVRDILTGIRLYTTFSKHSFTGETHPGDLPLWKLQSNTN